MLRFCKKIPIAQFLPTQFIGMAHLMAREKILEGLRDAVIQQDFHPRTSADDSRAA